MRFQDRVAIVTGGGSGIGRAVSTLLAQGGARVAIFDIWEEGGTDLAKQLHASTGNTALFQKCDVSREREVEDAVAAVVSAFGKIDFLVNNAGGGVSPEEPPRERLRVTVDELSEEEWDKNIDTHLKGCFLCSKHAVRQMRRQGTGGAIVNTASVAGLVGYPNLHGYVAAKHGIVGLTKVMGLELVPYGIRVNAVAPGATNTNMLRGNRPELSDNAIEGIRERYPMGRPGTPEEIAAAFAYLLSDDASYVTGTVLTVDGGYVAR